MFLVAGHDQNEEEENHAGVESESSQETKTGGTAAELDQPTQSISQMLLAMETVSDDSNQGSVQSSISSSSKQSIQSKSSKPAQVLSENSQAASQNSDDIEMASNQNSEKDNDVASLSSSQDEDEDPNTDSRSDDSFKENKPVVRKIVVNPIELSDIESSNKLKPSEAPEAPTSEAPVHTENGNDLSDVDDDAEPMPSTSNGDLTPLRDSNQGTSFFKRKPKSPFKRSVGQTTPSEPKNYRLRCQCGAKNCRKYLF